MKKVLAKLFWNRREEADLNSESAKAAGYFLEKMGSPVSMIEKQAAINHLANGFSMGYRKCEENYGITKRK